MSYDCILTDVHGSGKRRAGVITLNRPKQLNALNDALMDELGAALLAFDADEAIGCIVLTGGEKAFAAGADIGMMAPYGFVDAYTQGLISRNWETIRQVRKPVIARGRRLRARRRLRAGDDVRLHDRRRHREVRPARDPASASSRVPAARSGCRALSRRPRRWT